MAHLNIDATAPSNVIPFPAPAHRRRRQISLVGAAYNVGMTHQWFHKLTPLQQWNKVSEWVTMCLEFQEERLHAANDEPQELDRA